MKKLVPVVLSTLLFAALASTVHALDPKKASELVQLRTPLTTQASCGNFAFPLDQLVAEDGSVSTLAVPSGRVLIVRRVQASLGGAQPGDQVSFDVRLFPEGRVVGYADRETGSLGSASLVVDFADGIRVGPASTLCVTFSNNTTVRTGYASGFIVKDK